MKACSTAGGGVMFIPDTIDRKGVVSYSSLVKEDRAKKPMKAFGRKIAAKKLNKAA